LINQIPSDVFVRYYSSLKRIHVDYCVPIQRGRQEVYLFWGPTGTGKTFQATQILDSDCYYKQPLTKWWDGYHGQMNVLVDEFRGKIEISHLLRWLDGYACSTEVKGGMVYLNTQKWIFTSNLSLDKWYPDLDADTYAALRRRFTEIVHMTLPFEEMMKGRRLVNKSKI